MTNSDASAIMKVTKQEEKKARGQKSLNRNFKEIPNPIEGGTVHQKHNIGFRYHQISGDKRKTNLPSERPELK